MKLILLPNEQSELKEIYTSAFANAVEILVVNAYLTSWQSSLVLNGDCTHFRMIVGKDFGITRKQACKDVMKWLPPDLKAHFRVADKIMGFHPKAVFWKIENGDCFSIVGSSNLTDAAFTTNTEANLYCKISNSDFVTAKKWVTKIAEFSSPISEDWLKTYIEAKRKNSQGSKKSQAVSIGEDNCAIALPTPKGTKKAVKDRRKKLEEYAASSAGLLELFRACARGKISSQEFYKKLPLYWGGEVGGRLQGHGWQILGARSNFQALSSSFMKIVEADDDQRDDVVIREIDSLATQKIPTRGAFLSEMLCLRFPELFPVLNDPIKQYLTKIRLRPPSNASQGAVYLDLALKMRIALAQNPSHFAKNLAELDTVIWLDTHQK
jgi:HKD family nuclease